MCNVHHSDAEKWDTIYRSKPPTATKPAYVLREFHHLLPRQGRALDIASGGGANALFLARRGLATQAWDISPVAINALIEVARTDRLRIDATVRDVIAKPPPEYAFDVIVVSHFLAREIMPAIIAALRANGLLFYQTFTQRSVDKSGPSSHAYRLGDNELLRLCKGLEIIAYREEGCIGDTRKGFRNEALCIGRRRKCPSN